MRRLLALSSSAALLVAATTGSAQSWVNFTNVSSSKLVSHIQQPSLLTLGQIGSVDERASCFVVGDFNQDGLRDVAVFCKSPNFDNGSPGGGPLKPHVLLLNAGNGILADSTPGLAPDFNAYPSHAREAVAVDVENDGDLDIVVSNTCAQDPFLFINRGGVAGAWLGFKRKLSWFTTEHGHTSFLQDYGGGLNSSSLAAGDVDADGDPDLVLGCYTPGNPYGQHEDKYLENIGGARFVEQTSIVLKAGVPNDLNMKTDLADMDEDQDLDIVLTNAFQNFSILYNEGGEFPRSSLIPGSGGRYDHALADFNLDGRVDAYSTGDAPHDTTTINTSVNSGNVVWTEAKNVEANPLGTGTEYFGGNTRAYDFDGDGRPDIGVADMITYGPWAELCTDGASYPFILLRGRDPQGGNVAAVYDPSGTDNQPVVADGVWDFAFWDGYLILATCQGLRLYQRN